MKKKERKSEKMGRAPCCNKVEVKKGAWTPEEDKILVDYITKNGHGTWRSFPKLAGLRRCGKSCRLRWTNYLRPDIKRGDFSLEEEQTIFQLHSLHGNRWAAIASQLPGRTDNEIKNFWNSHLRKRIPGTLQTTSLSKSTDTKHTSPPTRHMAEWVNIKKEAEADALETRPSMDPMNDNNFFLHEWGSNDREALQKHTDFNTVGWSIPSLRSIKFEPDSVVTLQPEPYFVGTSTSESCDQGVKESGRLKVEAEELTNASESQNSYEAENASDITLDLLLDFPNDGEYLQYV